MQGVVLKGIDPGPNPFKIPTALLEGQEGTNTSPRRQANTQSIKAKEGDQLLLRWRDKTAPSTPGVTIAGFSTPMFPPSTGADLAAAGTPVW